MCTTLEKLRGKKPEQLLTEYGISFIPPIDVFSLIKKIGIIEIPFDFTDFERAGKHEPGDVLGAIFSKGEDLGLFYRKNDTPHRKRFTIAHEIAHCCNDTDELKQKYIELRSQINSKTEKEYNANVFAGELLIPKKSLEDIHSKFIVAPPLSKLAEIFEVSNAVMAARLDYLELPYIKDKKVEETLI